jgi:hypothetical protein
MHNLYATPFLLLRGPTHSGAPRRGRRSNLDPGNRTCPAWRGHRPLACRPGKLGSFSHHRKVRFFLLTLFSNETYPLFPPAENWVRFARFIPGPTNAANDSRHCPHTPVPPSLASFCTVYSVSRVRRGEIGFVLHVFPAGSDAVSCSQMAGLGPWTGDAEPSVLAPPPSPPREDLPAAAAPGGANWLCSPGPPIRIFHSQLLSSAEVTADFALIRIGFVLPFSFCVPAQEGPACRTLRMHVIARSPAAKQSQPQGAPDRNEATLGI